MKVTWLNVRSSSTMWRAEDGVLGPCKAEVRMLLPTGPHQPWVVTATADIPGQDLWSKHWEYQRLRNAFVRYLTAKEEVERYLARNCPTH